MDDEEEVLLFLRSSGISFKAVLPVRKTYFAFKETTAPKEIGALSHTSFIAARFATSLTSKSALGVYAMRYFPPSMASSALGNAQEGSAIGLEVNNCSRTCFSSINKLGTTISATKKTGTKDSITNQNILPLALTLKFFAIAHLNAALSLSFSFLFLGLEVIFFGTFLLLM